MSHRMVGGRALMLDSTHLKASANKKKFTKEMVQVSTRAYEEDLNLAIEQDRQAREKSSKTERGGERRKGN